MKVKRITNIDTEVFEVGDIIDFKLTDGEKAQAMAVQQEKDGMIFCFVNCLEEEYRANKNIKDGEDNYKTASLREELNSEIFNRFPKELKMLMVPFDNGDFLRLPTEKEITGENYCGEYEDSHINQWIPMKSYKNRVALNGKNRTIHWYWVQNKARGFDFDFVYINYYGYANHGYDYFSGGVRPVFLLKQNNNKAD